MNAFFTTRRAAVALGTGFCCLLLIAADHGDAPETQEDPAADINDLYVFADEAKERLVVILTYGGMMPPMEDQSALYDPDVLYTIKIDTNNDNLADIETYIRYGSNDRGEMGFQVLNLPGGPAEIVGPVDQTVEVNGLQLCTGLFDDPFFFDLTGFQQTLQTGTLSFDSGRDDFAGSNVSAIVLEMSLSEITNGGENPTFAIWATTARDNPMAVAMISDHTHPRW